MIEQLQQERTDALEALNIKQRIAVEAIMGECKGNQRQAYIKAYGRKVNDSTTDRCASQLFLNSKVRCAIATIEALRSHKAEEQVDWNRDKAIAHLEAIIRLAKDKAITGSTAAMQAYTSAVRELNAISNLHKATTVNEAAAPPPLTAEDEREAHAVATELKLRLRRGTG